MKEQPNRKQRRTKYKERIKSKNKRIGMTCEQKKQLVLNNVMKIKKYISGRLFKFTYKQLINKDKIEIKINNKKCKFYFKDLIAGKHLVA